jgi:hypothetical protein
MSDCQGCTQPVPEGSRYCPRCGLAAGSAAPQLPAWQVESQPHREQWASRSHPWGSNEGSMGEAELLGDQPRHTNRRRRRLVIALVAALAIVAGIVVGVDSASGGHKQPTSSLAGSVPLQVSPTRNRPKAPNTLPASLGDEAIEVAPAVRDDPQVNDVIDLLSRYFAAINLHDDYAGWRNTLLPTPNRGTLDDYRGYRTTHDSAISINGIRDRPDGSLRVSVGFTSQQAPRYGGGYRCLNWSIEFSLVRYQHQYRIDLVASGHINKVAC